MRSILPLSCLGDISLRYSGKTKPFAFVVASLCTAVVVWMLATQPCKGGATPVQDITRPDAPQQASEPDSSNDQDFDFCSTASGILEVILVCVLTACILLASALHLARIRILAKHGYGIAIMDLVCTHIILRHVSETQVSQEERLLYTWINMLIAVLFISSIVAVILLAAIL